MNELTEAAKDLASDLVVGADALAKYTGLTKRQVYGCVDKGHLPIFKIGALVCGRKSVIMQWVLDQESRSTQNALNGISLGVSQ